MISVTDIEVAALAIWSTNALIATVPGDLKTGRLVPPETQPYAQLRCRGGPNHYYTEGGGQYWTEFKVELDIIGVGETTIGNLQKTVGSVFSDAAWTITGANWLYTFPTDGYPRLEQERREEIARGEDYWRALLSFDVAASANL